MSEIKENFKRGGGIAILKQYWRAGVLLPTLVQFCLLGKSRTALELLRMTASLKTQQRLERKYRKALNGFKYDETLKQDSVKKVWIFWWQGMEKAPELVKRCHQSVKENLLDWDIILITQDNFKQYVDFPDHILQKLEIGQITLTHLSDLLRLELLIRHGGLWLDATVLCTGSDIPKTIIDSDLFVYQAQKPGSNGMATVMSSWCMYARTNNMILMATRELLYEYWKKNTRMVDYFLLHQFFTIVCNKYPENSTKIPPFCNSVPHILLLHLFDKFDKQFWNDLSKMTCFHKLSYKLDAKKTEIPETYYQYIINPEKNN